MYENFGGGIGAFGHNIDKNSISSRMNSQTQLNLRPPSGTQYNHRVNQAHGIRALDFGNNLQDASLRSGRSALSNISGLSKRDKSPIV